MNIKCQICNNESNLITLYTYGSADKYEKWMGIEDVNRCWLMCMRCGFHFQIRNYDIKKLEKIYKYGYRQKGFRTETIEEAFERIRNTEDNENESRYIWFGMHIKYEESKNVLDIGSGIGVWPEILTRTGFNVDCVEENELSIDFIYEKLGLKCFNGIDNVLGEYDVISLIHVLEHIEKPVVFLKKIKKLLREGGKIFVEVPDASEFKYLEKDHDEFNSCHVVFYDMGNLFRILKFAGYHVTDMHIEKTKQRNLTRIMCLAVN